MQAPIESARKARNTKCGWKRVWLGALGVGVPAEPVKAQTDHLAIGQGALLGDAW
jgi:hypothetical protein